MRARRLTVKGIYQTNFSEYDNLFLLTDLYLVNRLNNWAPGQVSGAELQVRDYDKLEDITYRIATDTDNKQDIYGGTLLCSKHRADESPDICLARSARPECMGDSDSDGRRSRFHP